MAEVHALDNYYLAITLLITIGYQLFFFSIAFSLKFDKLTGMSLRDRTCRLSRSWGMHSEDYLPLTCVY